MILTELIEVNYQWLPKDFSKIAELYEVSVIFIAEVCFVFEQQGDCVKAEIF